MPVHESVQSTFAVDLPQATVATETSLTSVVEDVFCSCVTGARLHVPNLPKGNASDFFPNTYPHIGAIALFLYPNNVYHMAYIDYVGPKGFHVIHYNKERCKKTKEWIMYGNPHIRGFYKVP